MEIIEWCDEFRSSKRGGARRAEASGHGLFSNELDVWTASRHMIRDATTAIGWPLTFFLDNQSILLLLLIARHATLEDERIAEGTPHCRIRFFDKDCSMICWDKVIELLWAELSTFYTPTSLLHFNVVDLLFCGVEDKKLRSERTLTLSRSLVVNSHSVLKLTWAASTCTFISPPTATNRNRTSADKRPIGVIDCGGHLKDITGSAVV
jgi:hypothetical protein